MSVTISIILGVDYCIVLGCCAVAHVRVHGIVHEGTGEEVACGAKRGVDGGSEAVWGICLVGHFEGCAFGG